MLGLSLGGMVRVGEVDGDRLTLSLGASDGSLESSVVVGDGEIGWLADDLEVVASLEGVLWPV